MAYLPSPSQMQQPGVVRWTLRQLDKALESNDERRAQELASLFDADTLNWLLEPEHEALTLEALRLLDSERWLPAHAALFERWHDLSPSCSLWAATHLARLAPDAFREYIVNGLDTGTRPEDVCLDPGLLEGLASMGPAASQLTSRLLDSVNPSAMPRHRVDLAVYLSIRAETPHAAALIATALCARSRDDDAASSLLADAYHAITDGLPYFQHFQAIADGEPASDLTGLPEYFVEGAPLAELDEVAAAHEGKRLKAAQRLLLRAGPDSPATILALSVFKAFAKRKPRREARSALASWYLASVAAAYAREAGDLSAMETADLLRLVSCELYPAPWMTPLTEELARRDDDETDARIIRVFELEEDSDGAFNIVDLMAARRSERFVEPLVETLQGGWSDPLTEPAVLALGRMGERAEVAIIDRWERLDETQRIYAFDVLERVGGERTVEHVARIFPEYRSTTEQLEMWCGLAETIPDPRFVEMLLPELRRAHPAVDECLIVLCELLDLQPEGLDEVRQRTAESGQRAFRRTEALFGGAEQDEPEDTIRMDLACPDCGEENSFAVRRVYVSPDGTGHDPYVGDDLTCPSCGFQGVFGPTKMAYLALTGLLMRKLAFQDQAGLDEGPLHLIRGFVADGREMSPAEAIGYYKRRLTLDPDDTSSLLGLGNFYRNLGPERLAADHYRRCLDLEPASVEAAWGLADMEDMAGNHGTALALLERAWSLRKDWYFHRLRDATPQEFEDAFVERHNELAQMLGRPAIAPVSRPSPAPAPGTWTRPSQPVRTRKIGRNEPCPCGSGKKYKRCCLRAGRR